MKIQIENLEKSKTKLTITVEKKQVEDAFQTALEELGKEIEIKGFRKGNAPLEKVRENVDRGKLHGKVINTLVPQAYMTVIQKEELKPAANPRIEIKKFAEGNELVFEAIICEVPDVDLGNWKEKLQELDKTSTIETAATLTEAKNKGKTEPKEATEDELSPQNVLSAIREEAKIELPEMLIEDEVNRMLSKLYDRLEALGMSPDEYLNSKGQSKQELKNEYETLAKTTLENEFILDKLIQELEIQVEEKEIEDAINAVPDEKAKENMNTSVNRAYIKSVLRKNKAIEKLLEIAGAKN